MFESVLLLIGCPAPELKHETIQNTGTKLIFFFGHGMTGDVLMLIFHSSWLPTVRVSFAFAGNGRKDPE